MRQRTHRVGKAHTSHFRAAELSGEWLGTESHKHVAPATLCQSFQQHTYPSSRNRSTQYQTSHTWYSSLKYFVYSGVKGESYCLKHTLTGGGRKEMLEERLSCCSTKSKKLLPIAESKIFHFQVCFVICLRATGRWSHHHSGWCKSQNC